MDRINLQKSYEKTVAFLTLGCKVNSYETDAMEQLFLDAGYQVKEFTEQASVYVINTCTVTNMADRKSRQMIHRAKKVNPEGIVVAVGCYVQAAKEVLEADEMIDIVIGNNRKNQIVLAVEQYRFNMDSVEMMADIQEEEGYEELVITSAGEKTRAYIKIQDGCNQFCSYCIIPYVRGRIRSRDKVDVVKETMRLVELGYKEIVLTGIHLSSYGVDLLGDTDFVKHQGQPLLALIEEISKIDGLERIRLGSLEPRIITEQFVITLSKITKFCPHFHLSLQSGCDETLNRMNRKYSAQEYYEKCMLLRMHFDKPAITTDVIVGFPGETEEEFLKTQRFLEKVAFAQLHIFKYSKRKGTKAEAMINQVSEQEKTRRSNQVIEMGEVMKRQYEEQFLGSTQKILIEEEIMIDNESYYVGHNERYMKVAVLASKSKGDLENQIIDAVVTNRVKNDLLAMFLN